MRYIILCIYSSCGCSMFSAQRSADINKPVWQTSYTEVSSEFHPIAADPVQPGEQTAGKTAEAFLLSFSTRNAETAMRSLAVQIATIEQYRHAHCLSQSDLDKLEAEAAWSKQANALLQKAVALHVSVLRLHVAMGESFVPEDKQSALAADRALRNYEKLYKRYLHAEEHARSELHKHGVERRHKRHQTQQQRKTPSTAPHQTPPPTQENNTAPSASRARGGFKLLSYCFVLIIGSCRHSYSIATTW